MCCFEVEVASGNSYCTNGKLYDGLRQQLQFSHVKEANGWEPEVSREAVVEKLTVITSDLDGRKVCQSDPQLFAGDVNWKVGGVSGAFQLNVQDDTGIFSEGKFTMIWRGG